mmetsp:Transcript_66699/g.148865  ORF Transcript_66699/g.148865 Transcript_66699/m.148865 type:complete len:141 (-) Transcript_66699:493-915(-)
MMFVLVASLSVGYLLNPLVNPMLATAVTSVQGQSVTRRKVVASLEPAFGNERKTLASGRTDAISPLRAVNAAPLSPRLLLRRLRVSHLRSKVAAIASALDIDETQRAYVIIQKAYASLGARPTGSLASRINVLYALLCSR